MSLYRKLTPAEVLAMVKGAKGVTQKPGGDSLTPGVTEPPAVVESSAIRGPRPEGLDAGGNGGELASAAEPDGAAGGNPAPSPSMQRRSKDRHKPTQAEYMRAYRARKKAEGA